MHDTNTTDQLRELLRILKANASSPVRQDGTVNAPQSSQTSKHRDTGGMDSPTKRRFGSQVIDVDAIKRPSPQKKKRMDFVQGSSKKCLPPSDSDEVIDISEYD